MPPSVGAGATGAAPPASVGRRRRDRRGRRRRGRDRGGRRAHGAARVGGRGGVGRVARRAVAGRVAVLDGRRRPRSRRPSRRRRRRRRPRRSSRRARPRPRRRRARRRSPCPGRRSTAPRAREEVVELVRAVVGRRERLQLLQLAGEDVRLLGRGGRRDRTRRRRRARCWPRGRSRRPDRCSRPGDSAAAAGEPRGPGPRTGVTGVGSSSPPQLRISRTRTMKITAIALSATRRRRW